MGGIYDRAHVAWRWWLAGNFLGVVPMLPWIFYMAGARDHSAESTGSAFIAWWRPFSNHFWIDWITEPFGQGLDYSLGNEFTNFIRSPLIGGHATYGVALLLGVSAVLAFLMLAAALLRTWKNRAHWRDSWKNDTRAFTPATLQAGFWFFGIFLTLSCMRFERHYLIVAFPLMALWIARLALPSEATERQWSAGRRLLLALCVTNALITFAFLDFIHVNGGAPDADYGKTYARQKLEDKLRTTSRRSTFESSLARDLGVNANHPAAARKMGTIIAGEPIRRAQFHMPRPAKAAVNNHRADGGVVGIAHAQPHKAVLFHQFLASLDRIGRFRTRADRPGIHQRVLHKMPAAQRRVPPGPLVSELCRANHGGIDMRVIFRRRRGTGDIGGPKTTETGIKITVAKRALGAG